MRHSVSQIEQRETPMIPRDDDGPVFDEPWQARAFAMTLKLAEHGVFSWKEWCTALSTEIKLAQAEGDPDLGDTYYLHWLRALETVIVAKQVSSQDNLQMAFKDWKAADHAREHGVAPVYIKGAGRTLQDSSSISSL